MRYRVLTWDEDVTWQYEAACLGYVSRTGRDPFFHPESPPSSGRGKISRVREAKKICATCPVKRVCLQFAVDHECSGVWGGTTERERRRISKS